MRNVECNSHCDVLHFSPVRVARLFLDCNGVFAIKAYVINFRLSKVACVDLALFFLDFALRIVIVCVALVVSPPI